MTTIVIFVKGGCLQSIQTNEDDPDVILCDADNEAQGDPGAVFFPVEPLTPADEQRLRQIALRADRAAQRHPVCPDCGDDLDTAHHGMIRPGILTLSCGGCGLGLSMAFTEKTP